MNPLVKQITPDAHGKSYLYETCWLAWSDEPKII